MDEVRIWDPLNEVFEDGGLSMWPVAFSFKSPNDRFLLPNGYAYASPGRAEAEGVGTTSGLRRFMYIVRVLLLSPSVHYDNLFKEWPHTHGTYMRWLRHFCQGSCGLK
jgi:hypothetical protein